MKHLGTALRFIIPVALVVAALTTGTPRTAEAQMSCSQYCRTVCIANGESCCWITSNTCGCC